MQCCIINLLSICKGKVKKDMKRELLFLLLFESVSEAVVMVLPVCSVSAGLVRDLTEVLKKESPSTGLYDKDDALPERLPLHLLAKKRMEVILVTVQFVEDIFICVQVRTENNKVAGYCCLVNRAWVRAHGFSIFNG